LKVTKHNLLTTACATLLLVMASGSALADARDKASQGTRYGQSDTAAQGSNSDRQKGKRPSGNSNAQNEAPTVSRSEAAAIAERVTGGRVLSISESGRYWQVKVLVDGKRVRIISIDMRSGRVR
jgi:uncharacterized membrane protein YkoI